MKRLICISIYYCTIILSLTAQELKVGDKMPEHAGFAKIINYPVSSLKIADIKSRLIIINYWSRGCSGCISHMPDMDALQKKFGSEIMIMPAVTGNEDEYRTFWAKNKFLNSTSLPTVVEDTLYKFFPHRGVPHEVWILDGKIFALTSSDKVTEKEIRDVLDGKPKNWAMGYAGLKPYDMNVPLMNDLATDSSFLSATTYKSTVTATMLNTKSDGFNNCTDEQRTFTRATFINQSLMRIISNCFYWLKYTGSSPFSEIDLKIVVKDSSKYFCKNEFDYPEWLRDNGLCYEIIIPGKLTMQDMIMQIFADLDQRFGLKTNIEKEKKSCWLLTMKPGVKRINDHLAKAYTEQQKQRQNILRTFGYPSPELKTFDSIAARSLFKHFFFSQTATIAHFAGSYYKNAVPVIDKTGYKEDFQISIQFPFSTASRVSMEMFKKKLEPHGLSLKNGVGEFTSLVVRAL